MSRLRVDDARLVEILRDEAACKGKETCRRLRIREMYFEPNASTYPEWSRRGVYTGGLDTRLMFVCESPTERKAQGDGPEFEAAGEPVWPCWQFTSQDERFRELREKHGFKNCMITNAVKCGVPRPSTPAKLTEEEISRCATFLRREVDIVRPRVLACMGRVAYRIVKEQVVRELPWFVLAVQLTHYSSRLAGGELLAQWDWEMSEIHNYLRDANDRGTRE